MRLTNKLCAQHLGWMFKKHWHVQGRRVPRDTGERSELEKIGFKVSDIQDVVQPKRSPKRFEIVGYKSKEILEDQSHPNWNGEICHIFGDGNVLLEGIQQAQVLTKTLAIEGLPNNLQESVDKLQITGNVDKNVQMYIMDSHVYDTEQEKLRIIKLPERPAFVLPRSYGIADKRKTRHILARFIYECEKLAGLSQSSSRNIANNLKFIASVEKDGAKVQFDVTAETVMFAKRPINPIKGKYKEELPEIFPIKPTITIPQKNMYKWNNFYPLPLEYPIPHPHTIYLQYSPTTVRNIYETPITQSQIESRNLLKAFAVAVSRAKLLYGENVKNIPQPIVVQSIQTDGKMFHFGVLQLNTLDIDGLNGIKNYWFAIPSIDLFSECCYNMGRPTLEGYNQDVFRYFYAFYKNN